MCIRDRIIGDRGTGKTTITIDTIINQAKINKVGLASGDPNFRPVYSIYVAIGQKNSNIVRTISALEAAGVATGLVSTAEQKVGDLRAGAWAHVTTPEAPELQRTLRAIRAAGDVAAVIESTSHGLALERVGEIPYLSLIHI